MHDVECTIRNQNSRQSLQELRNNPNNNNPQSNGFFFFFFLRLKSLFRSGTPFFADFVSTLRQESVNQQKKSMST